MKKLIVSIILIICLLQTTAQLRINVIVNNTPPAALYQWGNRADILLLQILPGQVLGVDRYKIKTEIKLLDGTIIGTTDLAKQTSYLIPRTNFTHRAADILPLENLLLTGRYKTSVAQSGKLPAENYQICITLVAATDLKSISETICKSFFIQAPQLPILITPNNQILNYQNANTSLTFRWTPLIPRPTTPVTYKLLVFEVLPGQKQMQALRSNQPIASILVKNTTQYIWQPRGILTDPILLLPEYQATDSLNQQRNFAEHITKAPQTKNDTTTTLTPNRVYIWTIQTLDALGNPITDASVSADGISQPAIFKTKNNTVKNPIQNIR
jgi:hypothetical protein